MSSNKRTADPTRLKRCRSPADIPRNHIPRNTDLIDFPSLIFFEPDYSLFTVSQASRRAWRLIQTRECRTYYPYYSGLMEHQAVELIGRKQSAANLLYGETGATGLSALNGGGSGSLLAELAAAVDQDESVTDLRDLFAAHAHLTDPAESAWFTTTEERAPVIDVVPELVALETQAAAEPIAPEPIAPPPAIEPAPPMPVSPSINASPLAGTRQSRQLGLFDLAGDSLPDLSPQPVLPAPAVGQQLSLF